MKKIWGQEDLGQEDLGQEDFGQEDLGTGRLGTGRFGTGRFGDRKIWGQEDLGTGRFGDRKIWDRKIWDRKIWGQEDLGTGRFGDGSSCIMYTCEYTCGMPAEVSFEVRPMEKARFLELNHVAMGCSFELHNRYGNKLEEGIYQQELAYLLGKRGIGIEREAGVTLRHGKFRKRYSCDLVMESGAIFECKATPSITSRHKQQLLQYLFLTDIPHGRLVNFRPPSVEGWYLNNGVPRVDRQKPAFIEENWEEIVDDNGLWNTARALIGDWGTGLFGCNYEEALLLEMGPEHVRKRDLTLADDGRIIGERLFHCFRDDSALVVTTHRKGRSQHAKHLRRLMRLTDLSGFRWINIDLHRVHAVYLKR